MEQSLAREAWELARRQHWVITRDQLLALGFSPKAVRHRVATRRLYPLWRKVYAVGRPDLDDAGWLLAAVLACGPMGYVSHDSAAGLWELRPPALAPIHITLVAGSDRRLGGIKVHRRPSLRPLDLAVHRGIPVTTPAMTLIDIAPGLRPYELEAAVNEADKCGLLDPEELRAEVECRRGRRGTAVLARLLDRRTLTLTDSALERRFLPIARRAGLPVPQTQAYVNGFRVDFYFEPAGLVVETDGLRYHRTPAQQSRDRVRDHAHAAAGLETLRFTHAQVYYEPAYVEHVLRQVARRLRANAPQAPP